MSVVRSIFVLTALIVGVAGCAQYEQLLIPEPGSSPKGSPIERASRQPGADIERPADPETQIPRVWQGDGRLTGQPDPRPLPASGPPRDGVTINLVDASVAAAAKAVLGDTLGLNFVVSEKVKGKITLQTTRAISRDDLLEMFDTVLEAQGAGIVEAGGLYSVLPIEEAKAAPGRIRGPGQTGRPAAGRGTEIIALQHVSASDMERILKAVAPNGGILRADTSRNVLILKGSRSEVQTLRDAIALFDVDWMRGMSFALYPVESSDPEAVVQDLEQVFASEQDGPTKGVVRFIANRRLRSILVITSRPAYLTKAETWIRNFDKVARATEKQVHVYHVQNRPAAEVAILLQRVYASQEQTRPVAVTGLEPPAVITQTAPAAAQPAPAATPGPLPQPLPGPPAVTGAPPVSIGPGPSGAPNPSPAPVDSGPVAALPAADPRTGRPLTTGSLPDDDRAARIRIVADETNNSLVITATSGEYRRLKNTLTKIDVAPAQVMLEATIAEVTLNDQLKFGLRWYFARGQSQFRLTDSVLGAVAPAFPGFSYFLNTPNVQVAINALSSITDVNIVSSPTLMVLDNKRAVLQVGDEVPVATQSAVGVVAPGAPVVNSIAFRSTGIILGITPRISDNGRVLLDIEQEVSDVVPTTSSTIDSPTIQQRRVRTTVAVNDGESLVLAGLIQDKSTRDRQAVPLLGGIPVVGNLFKNKTDTIRRTELLIAITPRIVKDAQKMDGIVQEFRDKLNFRTRPQRHGPPNRREQIDRLAR